MIGSTATFAAEVRVSQQIFAGCYVWDGSRVVEETLRFGYHTSKAPLGFLSGYTAVGNLPPDPKLMLVDGSVTQNRKSDVYATADVTFMDNTNTGAGQKLVDPISGYEFWIYRGIRLTPSLPGLQNWEWKQQGVFTVENLDISRFGDTLIYKCQMMDRTQRIKTNPWKRPFQVSNITGNYIACVKAIINDRAKGFTPNYLVTTVSTTAPSGVMNFDANSDPWSAVMDVAQAGGFEVRFSNVGDVVLTDIVDPQTASPVGIYSQDSEVVLENPGRQVSKADVYNGVIVRGNASWLLFPVTGEKWDDDPSSPTWRLGPFGEKPKIIESAIVGSDASAAVIAATEFVKVQGVWEDLTFMTYPDPRIEAGDVIRIDDPILGVRQKAMIESRTLPLLTGSMTAQIRRRRYVG
jgi:hypothetical protein